MPKIKILSRNLDNYLRDSKNDIKKIHRDYAPESHPFEDQREYVRALNAVKLERSFAKPFLFDLTGNSDAVKILQNHKNRLSSIFSGSYDGMIKEWNLATKNARFTIKGHSSCVNGISQIGDNIITCSDDKHIKYWNIDPLNEINSNTEPVFQIVHNNAIKCLDSQYSEISNSNNPYFAIGDTNGDIHLYEMSGRTDPINSFNWGTESMTSIKFNATESNLLLAAGMDNSVSLFDIRQNSALRKVTLEMGSNQVLWNPYNPIQFAVANEDNNVYLFDSRKLSHAQKILRGHISAVMSISYSPTGRQICTGSYDKTIKIFDIHGNAAPKAVDTYHTKRMQKIFSVTWTGDNKYILSASDEFNIRCWKAKAWDRLEHLSASQKSSRNYSEALKKKFQNYPEIKRIRNHRHYSKHIFVQSKQRKEQLNKLRRKERNRKLNIPGHETTPARQKMVVSEKE